MANPLDDDEIARIHDLSVDELHLVLEENHGRVRKRTAEKKAYVKTINELIAEAQARIETALDALEARRKAERGEDVQEEEKPKRGRGGRRQAAAA